MFREPNYAETLSTQTHGKGRDFSSLLFLGTYLKSYQFTLLKGILGVLVASGAVLALGQGLKLLVDKGFGTTDTSFLFQTLIFMGILVSILALASFSRVYYLSWLGERIVSDIRARVFKHLLTLDISFFESRGVGHLLSYLLTDATLVHVVISTSLPIALRNLLLLVGGISLLFFTSAKLTLVVGIIIPLAVIPLILYGKRVKSLSKASQDRVGHLSSLSEEVFDAIQTVQAFGQASFEIQKFNDRLEDSFIAAHAQIKVRAHMSMIVMIVTFGALCSVLWVGGTDVTGGTITTGELSSFLFYAALVGGAAGAISELLGDFQRAAGAMERIERLLKIESDLPTPQNPAPIPATMGDPKLGHISFKNVQFSYPARSDTKILSNFDLTVNPGEHLALVGPSGVGKSTVFKLALRFYDPSQGTVFYNGTTVKDLDLTQLRAMVSWVSQNTILFHGTVQENVLYGNPKADEETLIKALKSAQAWEFVKKLPQGIETQIGHKGCTLSGGERQRLALARALIKDAPLLLLDEATSALDAQNERLIQQAMWTVMQGRTSIVIAHRLATVQKADRIVMMDQNGEISGMGTHKELLRANKTYRDLVTLEFINLTEEALHDEHA